MRMRFELSNPDEADATLLVTMKVKHWKELRKQLGDAYPSWQLGYHISDVIRSAEESFCKRIDDKEEV